MGNCSTKQKGESMKPTVGLVISGAVLMLLNGCESADDAKAINDLINQADGNYTVQIKNNGNQGTVTKENPSTNDSPDTQQKTPPTTTTQPDDQQENQQPINNNEPADRPEKNPGSDQNNPTDIPQYGGDINFTEENPSGIDQGDKEDPTYQNGNGTQKEEPVEADTTKPRIKLKGSRRITIKQGDEFVDPGATATDDRDGEVAVTVSGEVDTSTPGRYVLTYTAVDSAGNKATKKRIVTVEAVEEEAPQDTTDEEPKDTPDTTDVPETTDQPDTTTETPDENENDNDNDAQTEASHTVRVLVMYDQLALDYYGSKERLTTRVNHLFALANQAYKESHIPAKVEAVGIQYFNTSKTDQDALVALHDSRTVQRTRDEYRADTVLLYQANDSGRGQCGISYVPHSITSADEIRDIMFAQVNINCPDTTTPHELGHNMGLRHSHKQNGDTGVKPYNYGLGHGVDRKFGTIMTYDYLFHVDKLTNKFSSPDYECVPGYPCGIPVGEPGEADAARVLKMTMPIVEKVYE